jgi:hypothetical protein
MLLKLRLLMSLSLFMQGEQWAAMYFAAFLAFVLLPFLLEFAIGSTVAWFAAIFIMGASFFSTKKNSFCTETGQQAKWRND